MSEWQPIETAPKDRTVIILRNDHEVVVGFYDDENGQFPWIFLDASIANGEPLNAYMENEHGPTHWMPLPAPPRATLEVSES